MMISFFQAKVILCTIGKYVIIFFITTLSYDIASGSEITPCNQIHKPLLVVYRCSGNIMTSITTGWVVTWFLFGYTARMFKYTVQIL